MKIKSIRGRGMSALGRLIDLDAMSSRIGFTTTKAASLDALPVDIKLIILTDLDSLDSLLSLILASRNFLTVFNAYRSTIVRTITVTRLSRAGPTPKRQKRMPVFPEFGPP
ncbi:hypothetical protein TWF481_004523 [Arthrobotrys musiformis]|uniref:F-box domain-containing protein n=1 Tax=Arthrobotrys musiformis TaxID=47236 RepID=A0AAV9WJS1_9PEZI